MISMKSKWSLWLKVLFLKKNIYRSYLVAFPVVTHFFSLTEALMWKVIIKELWCRCPLNYWRKGLSAWWIFFYYRALNVLHLMYCTERRLAGRCNSVEHWNVSGMWFHVKGFVYDNHMSATSLLTASCCNQIREQFLTCRFQVIISIST